LALFYVEKLLLLKVSPEKTHNAKDYAKGEEKEEKKEMSSSRVKNFVHNTNIVVRHNVPSSSCVFERLYVLTDVMYLLRRIS